MVESVSVGRTEGRAKPGWFWEVPQMKKTIKTAALALMLAFLMPWLASCQPNREIPSAGPAATDSAQADSPIPQDSSPVESEQGGENTLMVDGQSLEAAQFESDLGYVMSYPPELVTVNSWAGGETFEVTQAPGTYLAVSLYSGANIDQAVDRLQFDYAIDEEPTGIMFGAEGYAGVQMNQELDGLRQEYILFQNGEDIFLIELAVFTGDEGQEGLLQAMLDTFTVF